MKSERVSNSLSTNQVDSSQDATRKVKVGKSLYFKDMPEDVMIQIKQGAHARGITQPAYVSSVVRLHKKLIVLLNADKAKHLDSVRRILEEAGLPPVTH